MSFVMNFNFFHYFFIFIGSISAYCPFKKIYVETSLIIFTDDYLSIDTDDSQICQIIQQVHSTNGPYLLLSVTNFLMFSHRRPKNHNEIIVRNNDVQFIVDSKPKGYQILKSPISLQIPMNLNYRSILMFAQPMDCNENRLHCPEYSLCHNCSQYCFTEDLKCDGFDSCGEDETRCGSKQPQSPQTSYKYGREALSSSQIMLIGFFALNGSFIVFFLILSLCSAGIIVGRCRFYAKHSNDSRHTFIRYLREAIPPALQVAPVAPVSPEVPIAPSPTTRQRHSILSRINFQPAPALKELEPEVEDRDQSPTESICEPPAHQPEVFLRRQSLPFGLVASTELEPSRAKVRLGSRAMSFQH